MKTDRAALIGDPLFQCNLLLWMLQPSAAVPIEPLLHRAGYRLRFVEPKLPLPLPISNKLKEDELPVAEDAEPDLVVRGSGGEYVVLECKRSMFGYEPGRNEAVVRQCRAFLLQVPKVFCQALPGILPAEVTSTHVAYLACHDPNVPQFTGVQAIADELTAKSYQTAPRCLLTIDVSAGQIGIRTSVGHGELPPSLAAVLPSPFTPVESIADAETDPRPLYYVPWMPDCEPSPDEYNCNSFGNRVLAWAAAEIGSAQPPCDVELEMDSLMNKATEGFYSLWRNKESKKHVLRFAKDLLRKEIAKAPGASTPVALEFPKVGLRLSLPHSQAQGKIVEQFRKWKSENWLKPTQPELFPDLE